MIVLTNCHAVYKRWKSFFVNKILNDLAHQLADLPFEERAFRFSFGGNKNAVPYANERIFHRITLDQILKGKKIRLLIIVPEARALLPLKK